MINQTKKYSFNQLRPLFSLLLIAICIGGCVNKAGVKMGSPSDEIVKSVAVAFIKSNQGDPHSFGGWFIGTSPAHWLYMSNAFIGHVPPVKYADQCIKYPDKVIDRDSKKVGVLLSINEPSFIPSWNPGGSVSWPVPADWKVGDNGPTNHFTSWAIHTLTVESSSRTKMEKFDHWARRTIDNVYDFSAGDPHDWPLP